MRFLRRFFVRLSNFTAGRRADQRLQDKLGEHLAFQTDENLQSKDHDWARIGPVLTACAPVDLIKQGDDLMIRSCNLILCCFLMGLTLNASAQQSTPAASAPPPPVGTLAGHPDWPAAKNPGDVDTVDHLVASLYDVVSGPAGQRDWDRFRALFVPDGRLAWIVPGSAATKDKPARKGDAFFLTPDMFMQQNDPYFKTNGFFERSIVKRVEEFGNLVEVWSHPREASIRSRLCMLTDASGSPASSLMMSDQG